ncbi:MAG TPA: hypothetical protein VF844_05970 [Ktedonobacteraceae bacterium]
MAELKPSRWMLRVPDSHRECLTGATIRQQARFSERVKVVYFGTAKVGHFLKSSRLFSMAVHQSSGPAGGGPARNLRHLWATSLRCESLKPPGRVLY